MRTVLTLAFLFGLGSLPALAEENEQVDHELPLVKEGVLGTVNVLRELDVKTGKNRVTVKGAADFSTDWSGGPVESTIDGSTRSFLPKNPADPWVVTYELPGMRTVSSLAIQYRDAVPDAVQLEGSADGGRTWSHLFKSMDTRMGKGDYIKCFKPAKVNALRLTQKGRPETQEVIVYADPEVPLPLFGGKDSGAFNFLRDLYYKGKIEQFKNPVNDIWLEQYGGFPHVPFISRLCGSHAALCFGNPQGAGPGKRSFLRLDLDKAYPMYAGLVGCPDQERCIARNAKAEFYTANGKLDPAELKGNTIKDITGQGWILQKAWDKDPTLSKGFVLAKPGKYNQMLLVWDAQGPQQWCHLEMCGVEKPGAAAAKAPADSATEPVRPEGEKTP
jgi:hypothetical protein